MTITSKSVILAPAVPPARIRLREPVVKPLNPPPHQETQADRLFRDPRLGVLEGALIWNSVRQRELANCPLPAIVAAITKVCPPQIGEMLIESHKPFESQFADEPGGTRRFEGDRVIFVKFHGLGSPIRISPLLYFNDATFRDVRFARADTKKGNNVWVSYIEKAYVAWPNRGGRDYNALDFGHKSPIPVSTFMFDLAGRFDLIQKEVDQRPKVFRDVDKDLIDNKKRSYSIDVLKKLLKKCDKRPTIATTWADPRALIGSHTYVVEKFPSSKGKLKVWEAMRDSNPEVKIHDFWEEFDGVYQARKTSCT